MQSRRSDGRIASNRNLYEGAHSSIVKTEREKTREMNNARIAQQAAYKIKQDEFAKKLEEKKKKKLLEKLERYNKLVDFGEKMVVNKVSSDEKEYNIRRLRETQQRQYDDLIHNNYIQESRPQKERKEGLRNQVVDIKSKEEKKSNDIYNARSRRNNLDLERKQGLKNQVVDRKSKDEKSSDIYNARSRRNNLDLEEDGASSLNEYCIEQEFVEHPYFGNFLEDRDCDYNSSNQNLDQVDLQISNIRKKFSSPKHSNDTEKQNLPTKKNLEEKSTFAKLLEDCKHRNNILSSYEKYSALPKNICEGQSPKLVLVSENQKKKATLKGCRNSKHLEKGEGLIDNLTSIPHFKSSKPHKEGVIVKKSFEKEGSNNELDETNKCVTSQENTKTKKIAPTKVFPKNPHVPLKESDNKLLVAEEKVINVEGNQDLLGNGPEKGEQVMFDVGISVLETTSTDEANGVVGGRRLRYERGNHPLLAQLKQNPVQP